MREALATLPGVRQVEVDFDSEQALVTMKKDALDKAKLIQALEKVEFGGSVKSIKDVTAKSIGEEGADGQRKPKKPETTEEDT